MTNQGTPVDRFMPHWRNVEKACSILRQDREVVHDQECFFDAVEEYDFKIVSEFVKQGVDVNQKGPNGEVALMYALRSQDLRRVILLLGAGADPNAQTGVFGDLFEFENASDRVEALRALVEHGLDVSTELGPNGYCLFAAAIDRKDQGIIDVLEELGVKRPDWPPEEKEILPFELKTIQTRLVRALKKAWTEVKRTRKGETFCIFGLETDSDCMVLTPICNTLEQAEIELGDRLIDHPGEKYFVQGNSALYGAGQEHLADLRQEINNRKVNRSNTKKLLKIFEGALAELDEKNFFGSGKNRNKILLVVEIYDATDSEQKKIDKIVRRLNPKEPCKLYFG